MNGKKLGAMVGIMGMVLAAGCGGGSERPASSRPSGGASTPAAEAPMANADPAMGTSTVKGTVKLEGAAPQARKIRMDADPFCSKAHASGAYSDEVVTNDDGMLEYVFVYVKKGLEGKTYPTPTEPVTLDQRGCTYHPHVSGIMTGQTLKILNSDDTLHNIHALPKINKQFNIAMPKYVKEKEQSFTEPEVMVAVKCDVHSWMQTYIGVLPHPYFAVTDADGSFDLSKLPAGTYTVEAWHEKYGVQTQEVTVGDGETQEVMFAFQAS